MSLARVPVPKVVFHTQIKWADMTPNQRVDKLNELIANGGLPRKKIVDKYSYAVRMIRRGGDYPKINFPPPMKPERLKPNKELISGVDESADGRLARFFIEELPTQAEISESGRLIRHWRLIQQNSDILTIAQKFIAQFSIRGKYELFNTDNGFYKELERRNLLGALSFEMGALPE